MIARARAISRFVTGALFVLFLVACALGQDPTDTYNVGFPDNGVFSGSNFDSVQLNNGNLHIELPLFSVKGRAGLSVGFKYVYDSAGLFALKQYCHPKLGYCSYIAYPSNQVTGFLTGGWRVVGPTFYSIHSGFQTLACNGQVNAVAYSYSFSEPDGTVHGMQPDVEGDCPVWAPLGSQLYASDGSGWTMQVDPSSGGVITLISPTGEVIGYNDDTAQVTFVQDTNGNQITLGSDGVTITDTLGRTFSGEALTYFDSSGNTQTIQITNSTTESGGTQTALCGGKDYCTEYTATGPPSFTTVALPGSNLTYTINYSSSPSYGQPISITLPTGGQLAYAWTNQNSSPIISRTETSGGQSYTWNYVTGTTATVIDPAGNEQVATCAYLFWNNLSSPVCYVTEMQYYQGSAASGVLLKTVATNYEVVGGIGGANVLKETAGFLPTSETTTWNQANLVTQTQTTYDSVPSYWTSMLLKNPLEKREYAFGSGASGALVRRTDYTYLHDSSSTYSALNMLDRVSSKLVYAGSATSPTAQTTHNYTNFGSTYTTRGNLTQTSQGLLAGSSWSWLSTANIFDDLGNKLSTTDPNLNTTAFSFVDNWGTDTNCTLGRNTFAYLTTTTDALSHQTQNTYFRCTGLVSSTKDQNDINNSGTGTTFIYDFLNRSLNVGYPDGGQVTSSYVDVAPLSITQDKLVASGLNVQRTSAFEGLGRLQEGQLNDPDCAVGSKLVKSDHAYGFTSGSGEYTQISTPYCDTPNTIYGLMAKTQKDGIGRITSVTQTDGSIITTTYSGTSTGLTSTVTDEAGKARTSQTDALGRMTAVWEDPNGLNYLTNYSYDVLDNLLSVTQNSSRNRTFTYDSLSRLTCAANPEVTSSTNAPVSCPATNTGTYTAGTIGYTYDGDGNLLTKTAPAPNQTATSSTVATSYSYDKLNRLTQKTYAGGATTASVQYGYDGKVLTGCATTPPTLSDSNPIGSRTAMCDGSGATSWSHDPMNRILTEDRTINGTSAETKSIVYSYYVDGELNTIKYPPGLDGTVTYTPNGSGGFSAGRAISVVDTGNSINYVTSATYAPHGAQATITNGASILGAFSYNSRLQPLQMFYGTNTPPSLTGSTCPATVGNILHSVYNFNVGASDNGNVISIANCQNTNLTKNFTYDSLNRIETAATQGTTCTDCWGQMFGHMSGSTFVPGIDAWGNLFQITATQGSPTTLSQTMTGNNQFVGMTYDASGNLINNGGGNTYTFDDENRLTATAGYTYVYDGDGNRVKKCSNSNCTTGELYWRGTGSDTLSESSLVGSITEEYIFLNGERIARRDNSGGAVHYYFADHLGSADVITDNLGNIQKQSDYFPYGGEIVITGSDINNYKFTGKERDQESGLDDFDARFYSSPFGRFMTPDWEAKPIDVPYANFGNPQSLNLYSYVQNNPTTIGDPDGHQDGCGCGFTTVYPQWDAFVNNLVSTTQQVLQQDVNAISNAVQSAAEALNQSGFGRGAMAGPDPIPGLGNTFFKEDQEASHASQPPQSGQSTPAQPPEGPQEPYDREEHYGKTPTAADKAAIGGESVDHEPPLVQRYYEGDAKAGEKPGLQQTPQERRASAQDRTRMQPSTNQEQRSQGGQMSKYSKAMKKKFKLFKKP